MKNKIQRLLFAGMAAVILALSATACENTGEGIEDDVEEAADEVEDAVD